jgi:hypothetical protein
MLVRDETVQERHRVLDPLLQRQAFTRDLCEQQVKAGDLLVSQDVTDPERQRGTLLTVREVEDKIKKLIGPDRCHFEVHPVNPSKKCFYFVKPNQERWFVCAFENGLMPEWSIMSYKDEWVVDPSVDHIDKAEVLRTDGHAGMKKIRRPWREDVRGWRSVLVAILLKGLITPDQLERSLRETDRATWHKKLGKNVTEKTIV